MLLLLDEPTTGLDIRSKREVQTFVRDLRLEHDATIVLTTHDLDEAERLSDRIGILHEGRLVAEGPLETIMASDASWTGKFLREAERLASNAEAGTETR